MQRNGSFCTVAGIYTMEQTICKVLLWNLKVRLHSNMFFPGEVIYIIYIIYIVIYIICIYIHTQAYVNADLYISTYISFIVS